MAERELAILIKAKNMATGPIKTVTGDIGKLGKAGSRAGAGLKTLGKGAAIAGAGIAVALGGAIKSGLGSLAEREDVISATAAAIKSTGGAANVAAPQLRTWSEELEAASDAFVDDKAIQAAGNNLLRFTAVSGTVFKRTLTAAVDLGAAMKTGPEAAAKTLGKALSDPVKGMTALKKAGVVLTAAEQKRIKALVKANKPQEAQIALLEAVETRYKGAAKAAGGPYTDALNMLEDASEDAKMALATGFLPLITKVAQKLQTGLADPKTIDDIKGFGMDVAEGFDKVLDVASQVPWGSIKDAMGATAGAGKAALGFFTGLPPWVQTAVLTGWGLNKITGGAVTGIVGELGKGLVKGVLGMTAGVVHIKAGTVVGGPGGIPGAPGGTGGGGVAGTLVKGAGLLAGAGIAAELSPQLNSFAVDLRNQIAPNFPKLDLSDLSWPFGPKDTPTILPELGGNGLLGGRPSAAPAANDKVTTAVESMKGKIVGELAGAKTNIDATTTAVETMKGTVKTSIDLSGSTAARATDAGSSRIVAAVNAIPVPIINISATTVNRTTTVQQRTGTRSASRTRDGGDSGGGPGGQ